MHLELMWHCGAHHGSELFRGDLLAHSAVAFSRHVPGTAIDQVTPAARMVLQRTAASCAETEMQVRRLALAWLAFDDLAHGRGPAITITIRRADDRTH